ncbi:MAG TPA: pyrroloquinoline quinone biosynthesis peptide chaperone PqqD [Burkholderiales bacterium]|nr:pyrroloquinoline quinone biosynthesis peptide chaperone PqqD [Burkholderiales bacterium]
MTTDIPSAGQERPVVNPMFLFRWEETQQAYVLLYPEGVVKLNDTAGEILKRCDGAHTVGEMIDEIAREFAAAPVQIEQSVQKFLEVSHAKGWIRRQA